MAKRRAVWHTANEGQPFAAHLEPAFRSLARIEPKDTDPLSLASDVHAVVEDIKLARAAIERGDARQAAEIAFAVGANVVSFDLRFRWERVAEKWFVRLEQQRAAARATAELWRRQHASWLEQAAAWRAKQPRWGALRVAKEIDPQRDRTVRRVIAPLWPGRKSLAKR